MRQKKKNERKKLANLRQVMDCFVCNKMFFKTIIPFLLCVVGLQLPAFAQQDEINFTSLTTKDGLSSNTVNAILKDRYGVMWFGTEDGLDKFDGANFTVYR